MGVSRLSPEDTEKLVQAIRAIGLDKLQEPTVKQAYLNAFGSIEHAPIKFSRSAVHRYWHIAKGDWKGYVQSPKKAQPSATNTPPPPPKPIQTERHITPAAFEHCPHCGARFYVAVEKGSR